MSDGTALVDYARLWADHVRSAAPDAATARERLTRLAAEFEALLLVQVLRDLRKAGAWDEGERSDDRAQALFETLDLELASYLARVDGFGLGRELLEAFERQDRSPAPAVPPLALPAASPVAKSATVAPVAGVVTSEFGWRRDPFTGAARFHRGVDLRAAYGEEVRAAAPGQVVFSGEDGAYGMTVVLAHGDGTRTRYAHLSAVLVSIGDTVTGGTPVGRAGQSGRATGPHVHFEVIGPDGRALSPRAWAQAQVHKTT